MPDTNQKFADQWLSVQDALDLMHCLGEALSPNRHCVPAAFQAVLGWMADKQMLCLPEVQAFWDHAASAAKMRVAVRDHYAAKAAAEANHPETQQGKGDPELSAPEENHPEPEPMIGPAEDPGAAPGANGAEVPVAADSPATGTDRTAPVAGSRWSEAEIATARRMLAEGFSGSAIAAELGRPLPATYQKIKKLRASKPIPAGPRAAPVQKPAEPAAQGGRGPVSAGVTPVLETATAAPMNGQRVSPAPAVSPAVDAGAAGNKMLGGERGGLQRHSLADDAPVQVAVSAAALGAGPATEAGRPLWWREIEATLNALGYKGGWSASDDLALAEGLAKGVQLPILADQLGHEPAACKARFIALTPDGVTIEGQSHLLQVLRHRAGAALPVRN